uniref:Putative major capsid protein n=1 Tax=viral metagenome TaxID=1070528 RepID=A0A6M3K245_9ZZZZ
MSYLTLLDWAKRQDPNGSVADIVETLSESNPVIKDAAVVEGNLATGHRTTIRTGLPSVAWRLLNYGVQPSKSTTKQVDDACGILAGYSKVDVELAKLGGKAAAFRASEDDAFIEAMNQTVADTIFYGNTAVDPEKFLGLAARYNDTTAENGGNIILGGGAGADNTSIWLVTWGPKTCHLIFPQGSKAGVETRDLGELTVDDSATPAGQYQAYVTYFQWKLGLTLRDWRYVVRIANIDISDLTDDAASGADLIRKCISAYYKRPTVELGSMAKVTWYCNKTLAEYFHTQALNKFNVNLTLDQVEGKPVTKLLGAPVHVCDVIANDEDLVS